MAKIVGRNARILLGNRNISPDTSTVTMNLSAEAPETTAFCDNYRTRLANSIRDVETSFDGFYNNSASTIDVYMAAVMSTSALAGVYYQGLTASRFGREHVAIPSAYNMNFTVADAATVSVTLAGSGTLYHMASLSGSTADTYGTPTVSGAGASTLGSVDYGASYNSGTNYLTLRVLSLTGTTPDIAASIQYSANDVAWTTVYAINAATALSPAAITDTSASLVSLASGSRYRRLIVALAGTSPCASFFVASGSAVS